MKKIKNFLIRFLIALIDMIRPTLGPQGTCIYHISCRSFAKKILQKKPFYQAFPLICLRLFSCNPIGGIILRYYGYLRYHRYLRCHESLQYRKKK